MTDLIRPLPGKITQDVLARFLAKIDRGPRCWRWTGALTAAGYGQFKVGRSRYAYAHRYAYEQLVGPIPTGLTIDHLCRNRGCVNPNHLEPVTRGENVLRSPIAPSAIHARKLHCPRGHQYDYRNPTTGRRACRTCTHDSYMRRKVRAA